MSYYSAPSSGHKPLGVQPARPEGPSYCGADALPVGREADFGFVDWLAAQIGGNWVLAKRTKRIVERYGENVVCLSKRKYENLSELYTQVTPHRCLCEFCGDITLRSEYT